MVLFYMGNSFLLLLAYRLLWNLIMWYLLCTSGCVAPSGVSCFNQGCCGYISCACEGFGAFSFFLFVLFFRLTLFFRYCFTLASAALLDRVDLLLLRCGHVDCAVGDDCGSFTWWRVSRILLLFTGVLYAWSWWSVGTGDIFLIWQY